MKAEYRLTIGAPPNERRLVRLVEPLTIPQHHAASGGTVQMTFDAGDYCLIDDKGKVITGPIAAGPALDLAIRVLRGDQDARTHPQSLNSLAIALLASADIGGVLNLHLGGQGEKSTINGKEEDNDG